MQVSEYEKEQAEAVNPPADASSDAAQVPTVTAHAPTIPTRLKFKFLPGGIEGEMGKKYPLSTLFLPQENV